MFNINLQELLNQFSKTFAGPGSQVQIAIPYCKNIVCTPNFWRSKEERDKLRANFKRKQSDLKEEIALLTGEKASLEEKIRCELRETYVN